jgi:hypothetical protein
VEIPKLEVPKVEDSEITVTTVETGEKENTLAAKSKCVTPNPDYYFFGVLIWDYKHLPDLPFVKNDLKLIKKLATCYMGVPKRNIKILINPSKVDFLAELKLFTEKIKRPGSVLYFYYSGHGIMDNFGKFYFLPSNGAIVDLSMLDETALNWEKIKEILQRGNMARVKKVAIIDACRNLAMDKGFAVAGFGVSDPNMAVIFSTREKKISTLDKSLQYSAFTRALYEIAKEGLVNLDFNNDYLIELKEIEPSIKGKIKEFSISPAQEPEIIGNKNLPLFPVEK